ncbi:MAG: xylan 1,4-beta-xylosidase [Oscillospiraceae bacterium]|nr:xylan 1,4-beta-xylosidase [Oscillospiraceae bacterium]MBR4345961.1 xylan 1,4-beta-xylosidase [Oscillospiraceae bacterium]
MVGMANCEVLVDTLTGVQYLYIKNMDGNLAVTPLLAPDGKPLLADPGNMYRQ